MSKSEQLETIRSYCEKVMTAPNDVRPHEEVTSALVAVEAIVADGVQDQLARALLSAVVARMQIDLEARRVELIKPRLQ